VLPSSQRRRMRRGAKIPRRVTHALLSETHEQVDVLAAVNVGIGRQVDPAVGRNLTASHELDDFGAWHRAGTCWAGRHHTSPICHLSDSVYLCARHCRAACSNNYRQLQTGQGEALCTSQSLVPSPRSRKQSITDQCGGCPPLSKPVSVRHWLSGCTALGGLTRED
jgi:hypothetical protein